MVNVALTTAVGAGRIARRAGRAMAQRGVRRARARSLVGGTACGYHFLALEFFALSVFPKLLRIPDGKGLADAVLAAQPGGRRARADDVDARGSRARAGRPERPPDGPEVLRRRRRGERPGLSRRSATR